MNSVINTCIIFFLGLITVSSQESATLDFSYQINRVQKYLSISTSQLDTATTLSDLNHFYKEEWVKEYRSVIITVTKNGKKVTTTSSNDQLTAEQKSAIQTADLGSDIKVLVSYLPDNHLSNNRTMEMDFTFKVDPGQEAAFIGGENRLNQYIEENVLEKVSIKDVPQYQVAAIKFTINEEGQIMDANIAQPSTNKEADQLLLKTICDMPNWQAAQYSNGSKTKQEFVFTIGDHHSCTMNVLDIKSDVPPSSTADSK